MPNEIKNIIRLKGDEKKINEMLKAIQNDKYGIGTIDFNKIIPMPESLNIHDGSKTDKGLKAYQEFIEVYVSGRKTDETLKALKNIPSESEEAFLRQRTDISRDEWELGKTAWNNIQKNGTPTWFEWKTENWGTKWNAYDYEHVPEVDLYFLTANGAPHPILEKLSKMYPEITIEHEWINEGLGNKHFHETYRGVNKAQDHVDELYKLEEDLGIPENERLTEWFGDYGICSPKPYITDEQIISKLKDLQIKSNNATEKSADISKFNVHTLLEPKGNIVALASMTLYDAVTINSITINKGENGYYVKLPQKRTQDGNYIDVAHPINANLRNRINSVLLSAYLNGVNKQEFTYTGNIYITAQNSVKYNIEKTKNVLGRMDILVNDFVIHNAKLFVNNNGEVSLELPKFKTKDGKFNSLVSPANPNCYAQIKNSAITEHSTEYQFKKGTSDDVAKLAAEGLKFSVNYNSAGEAVIKFKESDATAVSKILNTIPNANATAKK
ncbi:MAG: septation protein SpoVG family protein [Ruminococcus sp.]|nr:septation protein SpoVG family protein [Ruminococcus sp.]